jgi:murein L,D-transpeptidase YcbB/YkuD
MTPPRRLALAAMAFPLILAATPAAAQSWRTAQAVVLRQLVTAAADDALPVLDCGQLDSALREGEGPSLDRVATDIALRLASMHLLGASSAQQRTGWEIEDGDRDIDVQAGLDRALATDALAAFFASLRPSHPDYAALRAAYAQEKDASRKLTLGRNMERWRWLPRDLGNDHLLVNTAVFEARLWRSGKVAGTWPVIVGKPATPTPVFSTLVTGVTFNPWWTIPASIVRERGGRFAASQGYVRTGGQWRQKPGPGNALGQMKLVMPNPYKVYLHDTPSKALFSRDTRAFSHGCVRVGDAIGFAAALLEGTRSRAQVDGAVRSRATVTYDLPARMPVYITYFTAAPGGDGTVQFRPDIYGRDGNLGAAKPQHPSCND